MSTPVIAFFNNKGGVGKTLLVYHLAWMYADLGIRVVAADLDPQANLTAAFLDEATLEALWSIGDHPDTVFGCIQPLLKGTGDINIPHIEIISDMQPSLFDEEPTGRIALLPGDLRLSSFEDELSDVWPKCLEEGKEREFRVISAFWRMMQLAATEHRAQIVLLDLGPNLGAINRSALIATDYVAVALSPDLFSLQGLRNLGPTLQKWRTGWKERLKKNTEKNLLLPSGKMEPIGYVVQQHAVRMDRPVKAYERWIARIPVEYREYVLNEPANTSITIENDPNCLGLLKHYHSLMPLAQEAHKPMFQLKPADGAIGSHLQAVQSAYLDFKHLAEKIVERIDLSLPDMAS